MQNDNFLKTSNILRDLVVGLGTCEKALAGALIAHTGWSLNDYRKKLEAENKEEAPLFTRKEELFITLFYGNLVLSPLSKLYFHWSEDVFKRHGVDDEFMKRMKKRLNNSMRGIEFE